MVSIDVDIEKLYADKEALHKQYVQNCGEDEGTENMICLDTEQVAIAADYWDNYQMWIKDENHETPNKYDLDVGMNYTPSDEDVVHVVSKALDEVNDIALVKIFEFTAKKINKLKSALESLRGL